MSTYIKVYRGNQIGDIKVTPYSVDHSAYDAHMFLVETPNKVILHTGDYRLHGYRGSKMIEVIEKLVKKNGKRKVDVLITEGTMMSRGSEKYYTEADMQKEMVGIITEIFFYSNYMWDLVRDNGEFEISKTENQKEEKEAGLRGYKEIQKGKYKQIKGVLLADEGFYHPLVTEEVIKTLNGNKKELMPIEYMRASYKVDEGREVILAEQNK